jgi:CxxC-x17-CxxC domain-containing protein
MIGADDGRGYNEMKSGQGLSPSGSQRTEAPLKLTACNSQSLKPPGLAEPLERTNDRRPTVYEYTDKVLRCMDCNEEFIFTAGEQLFFADKGLKNDPKRCKPCKVKKNERIAANMQAYGQAFPRERVEVTIKCALCGIETTVPFKPTQGRPVYCRDCFLRMRASTSHVHAQLS